MTLSLDREVHNNVVQAWKAHKDKTKLSQTRAAQAMGIGQSAFNQYLKGKHNGGIPLNRNFVIKFAKLVGTTPTDLGWTDNDVVVREAFIPVKYTTSGVELVSEKIAIESMVVPSDSEFAIRIDNNVNNDLVSNGDVYLCKDNTEYREGQRVFVLNETESKREVFIGRLVSNNEDQWSVSCSQGGVSFSVNIPKEAKVFDVIALYFCNA